MKIIRRFLGFLTLLLFSLGAHAEDFMMYTPMGVPGPFMKSVFMLEVVTSTGVYTGEYATSDPWMLTLGNLTLVSWNGPAGRPAPAIYLVKT